MNLVQQDPTIGPQQRKERKNKRPHHIFHGLTMRNKCFWSGLSLEINTGWVGPFVLLMSSTSGVSLGCALPHYSPSSPITTTSPNLPSRVPISILMVQGDFTQAASSPYSSPNQMKKTVSGSEWVVTVPYSADPGVTLYPDIPLHNNMPLLINPNILLLPG